MSNPADRFDAVEQLQLLAMAWLLEPDAATLVKLCRMPEMPAAVAAITPDDAALEYSQVILQQVPPYASLFLSEDGMLNGPITDQVLEEYARHGFKINREWRAGAADHLGVELHYLAYLVDESPAAARAFTAEHMNTWAPICCLAIERNRRAQLYAGVARSTRMLIRTVSRTVGRSSSSAITRESH